MQNDLFSSGGPENFNLHGKGHVIIYRSWLDRTSADNYFTNLNKGICWTQPEVQVYGKHHRIPRLQAWFGDAGAVMRYSGKAFYPSLWIKDLKSLKPKVEQAAKTEFNSVLANLYRDGNDGVGWHADDEFELGVQPTIASLSLGQSRTFVLKPKDQFLDRLPNETIRIELHNGDLLVMAGETQEAWQHALLKSSKIDRPRINLTFRKICR